jgi:hypothetical protein
MQLEYLDRAHQCQAALSQTSMQSVLQSHESMVQSHESMVQSHESIVQAVNEITMKEHAAEEWFMEVVLNGTISEGLP